jgi:hypothetical protein
VQLTVTSWLAQVSPSPTGLNEIALKLSVGPSPHHSPLLGVRSESASQQEEKVGVQTFFVNGDFVLG